jgi:kumamolisin
MRNQRDASGSTGGGVSAVFPRPSWQKNISIKSVNSAAIVGRIIPDIAANADWVASPYLLVVDGSSQGNGGTSAAAPLIASLIALINASLPKNNLVGYLTPVLYESSGGSTIGATCCTDVVSGGNKTAKAGGYEAGPGFDAVSGWGTPIGAKLAAAIAKLPAASTGK